MAANIVETSRVFARTVAQIEPSWIEPAARHLIKREYVAADWSEAREEVMAQERISLLGLTLSAGRMVNYGPVAPDESHRIFAREALVFRRMSRRPDWLASNDARIDAAARTEERLRQRGLIASDDELSAHYERVLPRQISSADALDAWTRRAGAPDIALLELSDEALYAQQPDPQVLRALPESIEVQGLRLGVTYRFDPDHAEDGATLQIPLLLLPGLTRQELERAIPGYELPRIEALLRSLPKHARKNLIPIAESARVFLEAQHAMPGLRLEDWVTREKGIAAGEVVFAKNGVPDYLTPTLMVVHNGTALANGSDLRTLRQEFSVRAREVLNARSGEHLGQIGKAGLPDVLPRSTPLPLENGEMTMFPALTVVDPVFVPKKSIRTTFSSIAFETSSK